MSDRALCGACFQHPDELAPTQHLEHASADEIAYVVVADLARRMSPKQTGRTHDAFATGASPVLKIQLGPTAIELIKAGK